MNSIKSAYFSNSPWKKGISTSINKKYFSSIFNPLFSFKLKKLLYCFIYSYPFSSSFNIVSCKKLYFKKSLSSIVIFDITGVL